MNDTPELPEDSGEPDPAAAEAEEGTEAPLNRAARRAKAKKAAPSHVGPQAEGAYPGTRAGRPRTKRSH
jgi:hypothetical protein